MRFYSAWSLSLVLALFLGRAGARHSSPVGPVVNPDLIQAELSEQCSLERLGIPVALRDKIKSLSKSAAVPLNIENSLTRQVSVMGKVVIARLQIEQSRCISRYFIGYRLLNASESSGRIKLALVNYVKFLKRTLKSDQLASCGQLSTEKLKDSCRRSNLEERLHSRVMARTAAELAALSGEMSDDGLSIGEVFLLHRDQLEHKIAEAARPAES